MSLPAYFAPTLDQVKQADNIGWCRLCGHEQGCVEPDAENYDCEECDANQVFGAQEYLMNGWIKE